MLGLPVVLELECGKLVTMVVLVALVLLVVVVTHQAFRVQEPLCTEMWPLNLGLDAHLVFEVLDNHDLGRCRAEPSYLHCVPLPEYICASHNGIHMNILGLSSHVLLLLPGQALTSGIS